MKLSIYALNEEQEKNTRRIEILQQQSSHINSLNAFFLSLEPEKQDLNLTELRKKLEIESILKGGIVKNIFYSDRYLNGKGARILADILEGDWLKSTSNLTIKVLEQPHKQPAHIRKQELKNSLDKLRAFKIILKVEVQLSHCDNHFEHARVLEIHMENGKKYKFLFDRGMDFLEDDLSTKTYRIKVPTYVIRTSQA